MILATSKKPATERCARRLRSFLTLVVAAICTVCSAAD